MATAVEDIKQRLSIVDVVGGYIKLEKAGGSFKARCPFHNEKTPSMYVSPDRGSYYCFGCGAKGDIFSFVEAFEGVDFKTALQQLAEKAGVQLSDYGQQYAPSGDKQQLDRLYAVLAAATKHYQALLAETPDALKYLHDRGLTDATIEAWQIGFAPAEWRSAKTALESEGFTIQELVAAGISKQSEKSAADYYDRFRSRIMFPLFNPSGNVIGFSGRVFNSDDPAKYVNSPETAVFKKSQFLYGLHAARQGIRRRGYTLLVEGQMDLIMCHQSGIDNAVATSGTAFTHEHVALIRRLSPKVLIAYDADPAGVSAAERAWKEAIAGGVEVKIADIPFGKDPADALKESPKDFIESLKEARHVVDYVLGHITKDAKDSREIGRTVTDRVLPLVSLITDPIEKAQSVRKIAHTLSVKDDVIWDSLRKKEATMPAQTQSASPAYSVAAPRISPRDSTMRRVVSFMTLLNKKDAAQGNTFRELLVTKTDAVYITHLEQQFPLTEELLFEAETLFIPAHHELLQQEFAVLLESEYVKALLSRALTELKHAEVRGDKENIQILLATCQVLTNRIQVLSGPQK